VADEEGGEEKVGWHRKVGGAVKGAAVGVGRGAAAVGRGAVGLVGGMYNVAANALHPDIAGTGWLVAAILLFISDTGFFGMMPATQFNVLDIKFLMLRGGLTRVLNLFLSPAVVVIMTVYTIRKIGQIELKDLIMKWVIVAFFVLIILFAGNLGSLIHLIFAFLFWISVLGPLYGEDADRIFLILLIIDFFGASLFAGLASMQSQAAFSMVENLLFFPIWLLFIAFNPHIEVQPTLKFFSMVFIAFVLIFNAGLNYPTIYGLVTGEAQRTPEEFEEKAVGTVRGFWDMIIGGTRARIEYAAGGYYEGEVEEAQKEPLGVYLEDIKPADKYFYEDESVTIWATLKVKNLDEDEPVNVKVSCIADKDTKKIAGEMYPRESFEIYTLEEEDLQCRFEPGSLEKGTRKVSIFTDFNFKTMAYLKSYFMDEARLRSMRRDNIDVFRHFGISDTKPVAKYTPGPVKIGIESKEPPIGLSTDYDARPLLGITLSNEDQWQGAIKKIDELIVYIPESMELDLASCGVFEPYPEGNMEEEMGEGHIAYRLMDDEKDKPKYQNIKEFVSFRCRLLIRPEKMQEVLGGVPFATKFFRVTADYQYGLEKSTSASVIRTPGFNVQLTPIKATAKDRLKCVATHDQLDIRSVEYRFVKVDQTGEEIIVQGQEMIGVGNERRYETEVDLERLPEGIKKGTVIRCVMSAILEDDSEVTDSSTITIANTPPTIEVSIKKPASINEDLVCNGTVKDVDDDPLTINWEFSEGYFERGRSERILSSGETYEAVVPKDELNVGERITCKMTASDGEVSGSPDEDFAIISG